MRCAKCGYISFDYLSECKKCQTSMASVREDLGFSATRPAVPSLLGSLLRDSQPTAQQKNQPADTEAYVPFSMQEEISGALNEGFTSEPAEAAPVRPVADPAETEEDFSLLDLSDEELELLIEKDASGQGKEEQIDATGLLDGDGDTHHHEPPSSPEDTSSALEIAMPEEAGASAAEEPLLSFDGFLETDTPDQPVAATDSSEAEQAPTIEFNHAAEQAGEPEKEFVIDLSESELDALLKRLEGGSKKKA